MRNLVIFTTVVLASGWVGRAVDVLMQNDEPESLGMLIWIVAPFGTALLLRAFAGDGWRDLGLQPRVKGNAGGYLASIAIYPSVAAVVLLVGWAGGWIRFDGFSAGALAVGSASALLPMFVKNIFEEFAWRGYLTPKIHASGINDLWGHVIVGLVWGFWHLPYFLFFLEPSVIREYTSLSLQTFIFMGLVTMVAWALVYGELRLLTGSVWPAVLMHMVEDAFLNELLIDGHVQIAPGMDWLVSPGVGVINVVLFAAIGVGLYQRRYRLRPRP